jgi:hypothetical protein
MLRGDDVLPELDRWEGPEYARVHVELHDGAVAWAYEWRAPLDDFRDVPDGRWPPDR